MPEQLKGSLWSAILNPASPRYQQWLSILEGNPPIKLPVKLADLGPERDVPVYQLDIAKLTREQRSRLIIWICEKFNEPVDEVESALDTVGFPIREVDVIVSFSLRAFI